MMLLALSLAALPARASTPEPTTGSVTVHYLASDAVADDTTEDTTPTDATDDEDEDSVKSEKEDVKSGRADVKTVDDDDNGKKAKKRVIKVIQKKTFMKIGRYEVGPEIGFVTNDPFLNRYVIGATLDYHVTEIFAAEIQFGYAPILGSGGENDPDWKALSKQLLLENSVSPDISKLDAMASGALAFSPIYGKASVGRKIIAFDMYGAFGLGVVHTADDPEALQVDAGDPAFVGSDQEWHPTTVISGGARVAFGESIAARLEGKSMSYIETINSTTLEMKNNFILQGGVTFFFPSMK